MTEEHIMKGIKLNCPYCSHKIFIGAIRRICLVFYTSRIQCLSCKEYSCMDYDHRRKIGLFWQYVFSFIFVIWLFFTIPFYMIIYIDMVTNELGIIKFISSTWKTPTLLFVHASLGLSFIFFYARLRLSSPLKKHHIPRIRKKIRIAIIVGTIVCLAWVFLLT